MTGRQQVTLALAVLVGLLVTAAALWAAGPPAGTYTATFGDEKWALKFDGKGKVTVTQKDEVQVKGSYNVNDDEITVTDESGPRAGKGDRKTGKYKWKLEGKKLTFTTVEDKSEGRERALTAGPWTRED